MFSKLDSEGAFWITFWGIAIFAIISVATIIAVSTYMNERAHQKSISACISQPDRVYVRGSCVRTDTRIFIDNMGNIRS